jgi:hypothetical protein
MTNGAGSRWQSVSAWAWMNQCFIKKLIPIGVGEAQGFNSRYAATVAHPFSNQRM